MPKRRNPFGECSPLQLKVHVGKKEVDMGVGQEQNMKNVYDRTRQMLFQGSKKSFAGKVTTDANENVVYGDVNGQHGQTKEEIPMEEEDCPQPADQMTITASGTLTTVRTGMAGQGDSKQKSSWSNFLSAKGKGPAAPQPKCQCCRGQAASQERCAFCEQSVCVDCIRPCYSCCANFCQLCSVMNYEGNTETSYCLSCAS